MFLSVSPRSERPRQNEVISLKNSNFKKRSKAVLKVLCAVGILSILTVGCGSAKADDTAQSGNTNPGGEIETEAVGETATAAGEESAAEETKPTVDASKVEEVLNGDAEISEKLQSLTALNADACAWLEIPGVGISQPILQCRTDDEYYLTHNAAGEEDAQGALYTETANSTDFTDGNTVIYGRNTDDRFGTLHNYQDRTFFDENRDVRIYLPEKTLQYRIFAAYPYDDKHLIAAYDFSDPVVFHNYLESIFSIRQIDAFIDESMDVTENNKIITLETGITGEADQRYLVQAVLVEE